MSKKPDHCAHVAAFHAHMTDVISGDFSGDLLSGRSRCSGPDYAINWVRIQLQEATLAIEFYKRAGGAA